MRLTHGLLRMPSYRRKTQFGVQTAIGVDNGSNLGDRLIAEVGGGHDLSGGQSDAVGARGSRLLVAAWENLANDIRSSRQSGEGVVAGGVCGGFNIADFERAGVAHINVDRDIGDTEFTGVLFAIAVGVVEDRPGDGAQRR